ncbi:CheR family methyltransferase [Pararhizobium sp. LjRoot235]|uniref:CheR family methyltransferase n=1 Tax=Pararhizobium sp. LjRoot235 TaxID=3342291 RepID=UPI003F4F8093
MWEGNMYQASVKLRPTRLAFAAKRCRSGGCPIQIWSAGCATGPYSLAILLEEERLAESARITATDISRRALMKAKVAEYSAWPLVPAEVADNLEVRSRREVADLARSLAGYS